jgi:L-threonylcarbamoyladenylate synthase
MARILSPTPETLALAAKILRDGGLVAFPTETVYGLGADALNADAVARIFAAKGRPAHNPLIVHIADASELPQIAGPVPSARPLMDRFWPGPLTLVFPKAPSVPDIVTAGGPTVAVRIPNHPVALALLSAAGTPVAAPSANRSEQISPTRAEHVADSLGDSIDLVLDGGPCAVGLESTVLDVTVWPPRIMRPGMIARADLEDALGITLDDGETTANDEPILRSPGRMARHYAPRKPLTIAEDIRTAARDCLTPAAVLARSGPPSDLPAGAYVIPMPSDPDSYAAALYAALHQADALPVAAILVEAVPGDARWQAIRDRLIRAATPAG